MKRLIIVVCVLVVTKGAIFSPSRSLRLLRTRPRIRRPQAYMPDGQLKSHSLRVM